MKKVALLTIALLMVCNFAFASVYDFSNPTYSLELDFSINDSKSLVRTGIEGQFFDKYKLNILDSTLTFALVSLNFFPVTDISEFTATLFNSAGNELQRAILSETDEADTLRLSIPDLATSTYYLGISGIGTGAAGIKGSYSGFIATSAPVPVPAAALLLGAGLLGIVGIRRRQIS